MYIGDPDNSQATPQNMLMHRTEKNHVDHDSLFTNIVVDANCIRSSALNQRVEKVVTKEPSWYSASEEFYHHKILAENSIVKLCPESFSGENQGFNGIFNEQESQYSYVGLFNEGTQIKSYHSTKGLEDAFNQPETAHLKVENAHFIQPRIFKDGSIVVTDNYGQLWHWTP